MTNDNEATAAEEIFLDIIGDAVASYDYDMYEVENKNSVRMICSDFLEEKILNFDELEIKCIKFAHKNIVYYLGGHLEEKIEAIRINYISKIFDTIKEKKKNKEYNDYNDGKYTIILGVLIINSDKLCSFELSELMYNAYYIGIKPKIIKEILENRIKNFHVNLN